MDMNDAELASTALRMWANYIETGDVSISSTDCTNMGQSQKVKVINDQQKRFVDRLINLSIDIL
jgi:hypothetical protein